MAEDNQPEPEETTTKRVLLYIQENPGCHLRKIKKELELAMGTVQYQLDRLEKAGKIKSNRHGLYKYYFSVDLIESDKDVLEVLTQETAREILMFIIERVNPTHTDISAKIQISSASVNWHIRRLMEFGLIDEEKEGKYKRYRLRVDSKSIIALIKNYYPSIWDKWSGRLAEMFLSMSTRPLEKADDES